MTTLNDIVCYYLSNNKGERYDNPDRSDLQAL